VFVSLDTQDLIVPPALNAPPLPMITLIVNALVMVSVKEPLAPVSVDLAMSVRIVALMMVAVALNTAVVTVNVSLVYATVISASLVPTAKLKTLVPATAPLKVFANRATVYVILVSLVAIVAKLIPQFVPRDTMLHAPVVVSVPSDNVSAISAIKVMLAKDFLHLTLNPSVSLTIALVVVIARTNAASVIPATMVPTVKRRAAPTNAVLMVTVILASAAVNLVTPVLVVIVYLVVLMTAPVTVNATRVSVFAILTILVPIVAL
jgi:hypothetical protein